MEPVQIEPLLTAIMGTVLTRTLDKAVLLETQPTELVPVTE